MTQEASNDALNEPKRFKSEDDNKEAVLPEKSTSTSQIWLAAIWFM